MLKSFSNYDAILAVAIAIATTLIALAARPLMPVDETRYLSVAWEMHTDGEYIVPHLNGATYSHKPPLLFWLINLVWMIGGVHAFTARLISPGLGLLTLIATVYFARRLWPAQRAIAGTAALVLATGGGWALFSSLTMFDSGMSLFVILWMIAIYHTAHPAMTSTPWRWHILGTVAIAGGILQKGPVVLVYALPIIITARLWQPSIPRQWFVRSLAMIFGGALISLAWVIPAVIVGGEQYTEAILWKQSAGRVVQAFAHRRPIWWYLPLVPAILFPWSLGSLPRRGLSSALNEPSLRFCLCAIIPPFVIFSLMSGKQAHYLLPLLPLFAIILTRLLYTGQDRLASRPIAEAISAAVVIAALWIVPAIADQHEMLEPFAGLSRYWSLPLIPVAIAGLIVRFPTPAHRIRWGALGWTLTIAIGHTALFQAVHDGYDVTRTAQQISKLQHQNVPVAFLGKYAGQFQFAGRLERPIDVLANDQALTDWLCQHPNGYVVISRDRSQTTEHPSTLSSPAHLRDLKANRMELWAVADLHDANSARLGLTQRREGAKAEKF
jgi:4-amino-4-deoxy-L-arabinose transferase-like glycosyltransferase